MMTVELLATPYLFFPINLKLYISWGHPVSCVIHLKISIILIFLISLRRLHSNNYRLFTLYTSELISILKGKQNGLQLDMPIPR